MFIVDAHLDLAYSAFNFGRDLRQPLTAVRAAESSNQAGGIATVSLPALQEAGVGLVLGTLLALPASSPLAKNSNGRLVYHTAAEAHAVAHTQLDYYHRLADEVETIRLVGDLTTLDAVVASHQPEAGKALLGIVPLMAGADPVREPQELEMWYERGLRLIGPAWDDTRYAAGAWRGQGGLTKDGYHLLEVMANFGFILDISHLSAKAANAALERYQGAVVATHANAQALVPGAQQLSDSQIRRLGERSGVIGIALFNGFLRRDYARGDPKQGVTLDHVIAHIDHICQLLGDAAHVGLGTDLDGGFGAQDIPLEMDSVAQLPLIASRLKERGYDAANVANIMGQNWLALLRRAFA